MNDDMSNPPSAVQRAKDDQRSIMEVLSRGRSQAGTARLILSSSWLVQHDARVAAKALRDTAEWGDTMSPDDWGLRYVYTFMLRTRADKIERGES